MTTPRVRIEPELGILCDFCSDPGPRWRYPCADFVSKSTSLPGVVTQESKGDWAACTTCSELIEHDRWHVLAFRAAAKLYENMPHIPFDKLAGSMYELHMEFRRARL